VDPQRSLSRRERQIMDIVYARGEATVIQVLDDMSDPPTRVSVRTLMRILEEKGHLKHTERGNKYVYRPTRPRERVGRSALQRVLTTFFGGSIEQAVAAYFADRGPGVTDEELAGLAELIRRAQDKGEKS
jgi:BlaI family transcriptional regulator, penicillinase repressor